MNPRIVEQYHGLDEKRTSQISYIDNIKDAYLSYMVLMT